MSESIKKTVKPVRLTGNPASTGIGMGPAWIMPESKASVKPEKIEKNMAQSEYNRVQKAFGDVLNSFEMLKSNSDTGEINQIVDSQIEVLKDPQLMEEIRSKIVENYFGSSYAIFESFNKYIELLDGTNAEWAKERMVDIVSIRDELMHTLESRDYDMLVEKNGIVFADEISATDLIKLSSMEISGIVMHKGGLTSHAVILAQSLDLPCIVGVDWQRAKVKQKAPVLLDGGSGEIIIHPGEAEKKKYIERRHAHLEEKSKVLEWAQKPTETKCGSTFIIRANIEFENELPRLKTHGAKGVGLLRTESCLFQSTDFDVTGQMNFYRTVVEKADGDSVTIRLFDAGGDKLLEDHGNESNPFLGWRGIRMLLDKPELLNQQMEAILRISGEFPGQLKLMVPMVSRIEEIESVHQTVENVKQTLKERDIYFDDELPIGIMIEVPGIALMASEAAEIVDFFSIGTNDLTQYTLAVDRGNEHISGLYTSTHPAVWRLIKMVKEGADTQGIPVSVCGEMASRPELAACFLGMGINEISMTTNSIPYVKSVLCQSSMKEMEQLAKRVLNSTHVKKADTLLKDWLQEKTETLSS